jgi:hypothetical protein
MLESATGMRLRVSLIILGVSVVVFPTQKSAVAPSTVEQTPGKFTDVTSALGVHFQNVSTHTSKKYLPETMGAGVALFDSHLGLCLGNPELVDAKLTRRPGASGDLDWLDQLED